MAAATRPLSSAACVKRSILDSVLEKATGVSRAVGATDRTRFDDYLQSIRDVERRIQNAEARNEREIPVVEQPDGIRRSFRHMPSSCSTCRFSRIRPT